MGCGSSQEVVPRSPPQNNNVPNGNVKTDPGPVPNTVADSAPKREDEKPRSNSRGSRRSSSSSSSSSSSEGSIKNKPKPQEKETQKPEETKPEEKEKEPEPVEVQEHVQEEAEEKPESNKETEKPNFTEEVLKSFVKLEGDIKEIENKVQDSNLQDEYKRLLDMYKAIELQGQKVEELKRQTIKEYQDVIQVTHPSVRAMFISEYQHDAQVAKEQQEYLDALNRQEVAQQELNSAKEQYKNLYNAFNSHSQTIKEDNKNLQDLKYKQEALLGKIFNDSYGSDKEWRLEMELDLLGEKKERIKGVHYKWTNARNFVAAASAQINWAAKRWGQIYLHNVQNQTVKYQMTAETRNHLVAAVQNVRTSHKFLDPIKVPYYTKDDITQMEGALNTIFHDVQYPLRYRLSHTCFTEHFNKSKNLFNWIDSVLKSTINKDYEEVKKSYHVKYFELKEERLNLIKNIVKEKLGVELKMELEKDEYKESEATEMSDQQAIKPGEVVKEEGDDQAPEPEAQSEEPAAEIPPEETPATDTTEGADTGAQPEGEPADAKPKVVAVPLSELAPAPNQEELFGNIEQLKKKHEDEIAEFEKAQEVNKARVDQGLQEKLQARRMRRRRMQQQQEETAALCGDNDESLPAPLE